MKEIKNYSDYATYGDMTIWKRAKTYEHTMMRIRSFAEKARNQTKVDPAEKFKAMMLTRLSKITHLDKLVAGVVALEDAGYKDLAEYFEARLVMDMME